MSWFNARDNMNNGVRAFRETNYSAAAEYFEQALSYDPTVPNGELYLGLSYSQMFIPGLTTPENERNAQRAIEVLEGLLEKEPMNATAIAALASIYQNTLELQRAREYYLLQTTASPDDAVGYYSVGSIDWYILSSNVEMPEEQRMELIEEGQEYLDKALGLDPSYVDAAVYKNLLYRQEADLIPEDSEDEEALARREELTAQADEWFDRAMTMREENAERDAQGLVVN
jgi:tetratricopeptide (TPR) repeat protein